ncbi:T9SS sorting signal type C domain-containing protein [Flavobacterium piscis]|uniref:T9SS sorting signal type C domain-containing protein n=1 Tax=Flavobacterium piscis TaxID=1114874 RepID=A0ABU1YEK5_9FLAO|nr:T9SS sorting signal type C domain-containing protein [Flavobacterium piscis]MDR7212676.1 hypothetical protein [Flavobacterium piscis]
MIKKLPLIINLLFPKQNQNTPAIKTTKSFGNNIIWLCFTLLAFQMNFGQSCNVVKTGDFTGSVNTTNWSVQTAATGWHYSAAWAPNEVYIEADGVTNASLKQSLTGLVGSSLTVSFKIKGQNYSRLSTVNTTATLVIMVRGTTYLTVTNPGNNTVINNTTDIVTSNGATFTTSGFPLTVGANPAAPSSAINQGSITVTVPWNPATATTGDLEFVATTSTGGGDDWFLDDISVIATNPTSFNMTGTSVCAGTTATIGLNGSQLGVNYQLQIGGINTGAVVPGTGSAISFGNQTATGIYTVVATAGSTTCTTTMAGSVSISPNLPASISIAASPSGAICYGTSVTFTGTPTNGGTTPVYQWKLNGANVGTNATTYTNATLINGDVVTCVLTSNATPCLTGSPATSNAVTITTSGPTATGVTICAGGSGSLTSSYSCASTNTQTASGSGGTSKSTSYGGSGNTNISINFPALPVGAVVTNIATTITYTSNSPSWTNELRIQATPPASLGASQTDLQVSTSSSPGTITNTAFGTWGTASPVGTWLFRFRETFDDGVNPDANISNISIIVSYTIPGTLDWYTVPTGGTIVESGGTFNPINDAQVIAQGAPYSLLNNTNTPGTYTFYTACSSNPSCRTAVNFVINGSPTIAAILAPSALCSGGSLNPSAPTITANGSTVTASGWQLETTVGGGAYANLTVPYTVAFADNGKRIRYYATNSCGTGYSNVVAITINNVPAIATISSPAALCSGGSLNPSAPTVTANGSAVTASGWQLETTVGGNVFSNLALPYTVVFADNNKKIRYYATNGCGTVYSNEVTITVNSNPTTPTVGTITDITCGTSTGSIELAGLPNGNWTINQTGTAITSYNGNTTNYTVTGLAAGSYTFTVTNASECPSASTGLVAVTDVSSTTWNGSAWSNGTPSTTKSAIIASVTPNSPFTADLTACALTINPSVIATVPSGVTLTIINAVTTNGQLIFENNSGLVQDPAAAVNMNTGNIIYRRISSPMKNFDFSYWSSPVSGQTLLNLSPNTLSDKYMSYSGTGWKQEVASTKIMTPGTGYIIRTPKAGIWGNGENVIFPYAQPVQFRGIPNNGDISGQSVVPGNFYLIGNPYPSALDANEFLSDNTILNGTIYFWTHNTAIQQNGPKYIYVSDDYAAYNQLGGVAATSGGQEPLGYVAAGQSFFGSALSSGTIAFKNNMRVAGNNSQFFKPAKTSKSAKLEKHRLWLNMTNSGGAFKQTLIGYVTGATNEYEGDFDGRSFDGNSFIDFYSVNNANKFVIQGRALPFKESDKVPLGFRSTLAGDFTISIDKADGVLADQKVFLEDKQTNTIHELTQSDYTFTTAKGTFNDRFVVKYVNVTLGTGDFETADDGVEVIVKNKNTTISSEKENIDKVFIYDISGKQLYRKDKVSNGILTISNLNFAEQVLLVKIVLENGPTVTRKIIF